MVSRLGGYKDLLFVFIWREFLIRYRQTFIGVLWALIQPFTMMMVFVVVFGFVLKTQHEDYPFSLFFLCGILPWTFFSGSINNATSCLSGHSNLITKIYFPREIIPLSGVFINFIDFLIGFAAYVVLLFVYGIPLSGSFFWIVPLMGLLLLFTVSVAYLFSALNVYYRDVKLASGFVIQVLFFVTPVVYSLDRVDGVWGKLLYVNPLAFVVEGMRRATLEGSAPSVLAFSLHLCFALGFYFVVMKLFVRIEKAFADVI